MHSQVAVQYRHSPEGEDPTDRAPGTDARLRAQMRRGSRRPPPWAGRADIPGAGGGRAAEGWGAGGMAVAWL